MTEKCVLITGSEGGIGSALAKSFATSNYRVLGLDIQPNNNCPVDEYLRIDLNSLVNDPAYRKEAIATIKQKLTGNALTALVNNAAIQRVASFFELSDRDWLETMNVNLLAPAILTRELFPELARADGSVVNISSIHAIATKPGFSAYATSKAALSGLTRSLAIECGATVRVNAISPAAIDTEMLRAGFAANSEEFESLKRFHPVGRLGEPVDVAALCVFLCSEDARFLNGATIGLNGGIAARLYDPS